MLRETVAYIPSLYSIYATFSIGFHNGLRFLGRKCIIQPLLSSDFSIDLCFDDMLEQQGVGLKKPHMHINTEYFD